jgi:hypothetical protein
MSFWIVGVGLFVGSAVAVLGMLLALDALSRRLLWDAPAAIFQLTAVAHLAALVFAGVGTWRAATNGDRSRRARGRRPLWGWAAKPCVAVGGVPLLRWAPAEDHRRVRVRLARESTGR